MLTRIVLYFLKFPVFGHKRAGKLVYRDLITESKITLLRILFSSHTLQSNKAHHINLTIIRSNIYKHPRQQGTTWTYEIELAA